MWALFGGGGTHVPSSSGASSAPPGYMRRSSSKHAWPEKRYGDGGGSPLSLSHSALAKHPGRAVRHVARPSQPLAPARISRPTRAACLAAEEDDGAGAGGFDARNESHGHGTGSGEQQLTAKGAVHAERSD